jgi:hypothetical protein
VFGNINPIAGRRGGLAQHVLVRASEIAPKPEAVSFADAATLPVAGLSAWDCLDRLGQTKAGQRLLVLGAAGGVGSFVVQLGKLDEVHVTGVCREANAEWVPPTRRRPGDRLRSRSVFGRRGPLTIASSTPPPCRPSAHAAAGWFAAAGT